MRTSHTSGFESDHRHRNLTIVPRSTVDVGKCEVSVKPVEFVLCMKHALRACDVHTGTVIDLRVRESLSGRVGCVWLLTFSAQRPREK